MGQDGKLHILLHCSTVCPQHLAHGAVRQQLQQPVANTQPYVASVDALDVVVSAVCLRDRPPLLPLPT